MNKVSKPDMEEDCQWANQVMIHNTVHAMLSFPLLHKQTDDQNHSSSFYHTTQDW